MRWDVESMLWKVMEIVVGFDFVEKGAMRGRVTGTTHTSHKRDKTRFDVESSWSLD